MTLKKKIPRVLLGPALHFAKLYPYRQETAYDFEKECRIVLGLFQFAVFENITRDGNTLHLKHFSVEHYYRGAKIGEKCLRKFAQYIHHKDPSVDVIEFDLSRAPTNANHALIAEKRLNLLQEIGVTNAVIPPPSGGLHHVTGTWPRDKWAAPKPPSDPIV